MLLDFLKDFQWYNEPENVRFSEKGMQVLAKGKTDFWQAQHHNFSLDNGHFFYCNKMGDFGFKLKLVISDILGQSGLMIRINNLNWAKIGIISENKLQPCIGAVVTQRGHSDWSQIKLEAVPEEIWFKVLKKGNDYILFYSLDGEIYTKIRQFYLENEMPETKVGAYFCSPLPTSIESYLEAVEFL